MTINTSIIRKQIGMRQRKQTKGPELDLVKSFFSSFESIFGEKNYNLTVFMEPFLDIGFPDLIGVLWSEDSINNWCNERLSINKTDIRILNHLHLTKKSKSISDLCIELGYQMKDIDSSFNRLVKANLIFTSRTGVKCKPIKEIFAPKKIIAVEAKISNWNNVLNQAFLNQWFSSESYILFPGKKFKNEFLAQSKEKNIGILLENGSKFKNFKPKKNSIPTSYGSWLINEWLGRQLYLGHCAF